jgi:hypothetical protein
MADQRPEPACPHLRGRGEKAVDVVAEQRRLDQHPARAARALGDRVELAVAQERDVLLRQLGAGADLQRHALTRQRGRQLVHPREQLADDPAPQQVAHVRRGRDDGSAVGDRQPRQLDGLGQIDRPVVDARQQMEVELGPMHASSVTHGPETPANEQ